MICLQIFRGRLRAQLIRVPQIKRCIYFYLLDAAAASRMATNQDRLFGRG